MNKCIRELARDVYHSLSAQLENVVINEVSDIVKLRLTHDEIKERLRLQRLHPGKLTMLIEELKALGLDVSAGNQELRLALRVTKIPDSFNTLHELESYVKKNITLEIFHPTEKSS